MPQAAAQAPAPGPDVAWQVLESEEMKHGAKGFTVPPKAAGWMRMVWKDEAPGPKRLSIDLRTTSPAGDAPPVSLEFEGIFVDPVRVLPESKELHVGTLRSGDKPCQASFTVFSSTRERFTLEPEPDAVQKKEHPFVTCGRPRPLTEAECHALEQEKKAIVLSGYRVPVTVREQRDDGRKHDLGPFRVPVGLTSDARDEPLGLLVIGEVKGDVTVLSEDDRFQDRIVFPVFTRSMGDKKTVTVEADPGTELSFDRGPDFMKVELTPGESSGRGRKTWRLTVTIPPNAVSGHFPRTDDPALSDTAIYLKTKADRGVRIPVSGTASQR
jgi:hypothetical protein